jgi:hypothetical protein
MSQGATNLNTAGGSIVWPAPSEGGSAAPANPSPASGTSARTKPIGSVKTPTPIEPGKAALGTPPTTPSTLGDSVAAHLAQALQAHLGKASGGIPIAPPATALSNEEVDHHIDALIKAGAAPQSLKAHLAEWRRTHDSGKTAKESEAQKQAFDALEKAASAAQGDAQRELVIANLDAVLSRLEVKVQLKAIADAMDELKKNPKDAEAVRNIEKALKALQGEKKPAAPKTPKPQPPKDEAGNE